MKRYDFYGLGVDSFSYDELLAEVEKAIESRNPKVLYGHALWSIPMMNKYPEIYKYGNQSDILVTDGHPFFLLCKYFKRIPVGLEISIPQSVYMLLELANKKKLNVFLLGSDDSTNSMACEKVRMTYSNIKGCYGRNGYFSDTDHLKIISEINELDIDILLIGISSPQKEILSIEWKDKLNVGVIIPCGGMIDVLSGKTKLTPKIIKKLGLASFYRVIQEPRRLYKRYSFIYGFFFFRFLPIFVWYVVLLRRKDFSIPRYYKLDKND